MDSGCPVASHFELGSLARWRAVATSFRHSVVKPREPVCFFFLRPRGAPSNQKVIGPNFKSPEELWKIRHIVLGLAFSIGQHRQKSRTRFPTDFALVIEIAHRISTSFVLPQNLSYELTFGEINVIGFYVVVGDIDPEPQGLVHSDFHC